MVYLSLTRLHRWHLHQRSLACFCHIPSGSDVTVRLQNRCCHCCGHKQMEYDWVPSLSEQCCYAFVSHTDTNPSMEKAWVELEGIEAIVKTASKAKFFIEFHSSCLEGTVWCHMKTYILHKAVKQHSAKIHSCLSLQRHDAQVRMTHRAVTFPAFWNWAGPSNSCRRLARKFIWKRLKILFVLEVKFLTL